MNELLLLNEVSGAVDGNSRLPAPVFHDSYTVRVIDFSKLWSRQFFESLVALSERTGSDGFTLAVLEPDPEAYYRHHFGHYPVLHFTAGQTSQSYIDSVNRDPGGSPADAVIHNSTIVVIKPDSGRWLVYGDRDAEVAIIAARDVETLRSVEEVVPGSCTIREAVASGLVQLDPSGVRELIRNYS